ncbi:hypothetical protein DLAC_11554 [Tieghemostelium lacteum]|uniref:non-specific serine/threonine protein kinase n=1 Tax=Tieghemostelium lacteum TaxID=361077 RepID=A0A152A172_TIELA|nr:hypothetical protein DLAC_11554 [Tieghemostelium lacteum]|eukprot:KYQ99975.1 hypothetical protein DLAC_11554 [Tieghemostelium lacteum]
MANSFQIIFLVYLICVYFAIAYGYSPPYYYGSNYLFALPPIIGYIGGIAVRSNGGQTHRHSRGGHGHRSGGVGSASKGDVAAELQSHSDNELNLDDINNELGCYNCTHKHPKTINSDDHYESISSGIGGTLIQSDHEDKEIPEFLELSPEDRRKQEDLEMYGPQHRFLTPSQQSAAHKRYKNQIDQAQNPDPNLLNIYSPKLEKEFPSKRVLRNQAKVYADVNSNQPLEYSDYESYKITWNPVDRYEIINKIGRGKYSEVFFGINADTEDDVVIKILKPIQKFKMQREIKILETIKDGPNVITLLDTIRDPDSKICSLVFPFVNKTDVRELINYLTDDDLKYYMYELLRAIEYTHSRGVMHRDIKPQNIAIDHVNRKLYLLDWGLAEYYHPTKNYNVKVASRHYKPPELLVNMFDYDYSLDMWSLGCFFAGMILDRDPFFNGQDNNDQLLQITKVLGTDELLRYLDKYGLELNEEQESMIKQYSKKNWDRYIPYENDDIAHPLAIDFLDKLLKFDPQERLTAKEAMNHPYFDSLKKK